VEQFVFIVIKMRLDIKLSEILSISRTLSKKMIEQNLVKVNNEITNKPSFEVTEDDIIQSTELKQVQYDLEPINLNLKIVFEDEHLAVIDKPAGISTHPGIGDGGKTLINGLLYHFKNLSDINNEDGFVRPGIVHRLDKNTSGLMIIAKNNKSHELLSKIIELRDVKRTYTAFCYSKPKQNEAIIDRNIRRNKTDRSKMEICSQDDGKSAITHYEIKRVFALNQICLIECRLETGRTHQIRVHLTSIGCPIVGDDKYGVKTQREINVKFKSNPLVVDYLTNLKRHLLHSSKLSFQHPITKEMLNFESQSKDIENLISLLK